MPKARAVATELKITLRGVYPPIWRRVQVPSAITLADLHRVIQSAFDWRDERRHRFTIASRSFDSDGEDGLVLSALASPKAKLEYEYDFAASWRHDIVVERVDVPLRDPSAAYPCCIGGGRASPPEDCGGPWGYMGVLEALANPKHPDHDDHLAWLGVGWDAESFDLDAVNERLLARFEPRSSKRRSSKGRASKTSSAPPAPSLTTPLSEEETQLVAEILQVHSELDASGLLGLLHAVVVAPSEIEPAAWIDHVFPEGFGGRDVADAQERLSILLRHHNEVAAALAEGRVMAPASDEVLACRSFANGYVGGASLDPSWFGDPSLKVFFLHMAYLARRFDLVPLKARAKLESEGDPDARICEMLGALVVGAYDEMRAIREGAAAGTR